MLFRVTFWISIKIIWLFDRSTLGRLCSTYPSEIQWTIEISERPKPEFSAETGTGTEIIPVRFRLGNSYRNRNGPLLLL